MRASSRRLSISSDLDAAIAHMHTNKKGLNHQSIKCYTKD
jgi:hypothetical protein